MFREQLKISRTSERRSLYKILKKGIITIGFLDAKAKRLVSILS